MPVAMAHLQAESIFGRLGESVPSVQLQDSPNFSGESIAIGGGCAHTARSLTRCGEMRARLHLVVIIRKHKNNVNHLRVGMHALDLPFLIQPNEKHET
jgi:hypothetical protein